MWVVCGLAVDGWWAGGAWCVVGDVWWVVDGWVDGGCWVVGGWWWVVGDWCLMGGG